MSRVILFLFSLLLSVFAQAYSESQIKDYLVAKKTEQLLLLEKLVNINSGTENIGGILKTGEILRSEFAALGFKTRWEQGVTKMKRAPTLIAERVGTQGKRLLLIGHLDTVFSKDSAFQHFKKIANRAMGPGVIDDKGGDVVILYALKALAASKALENTTIRIALTGDEESSALPTAISRKPLVDLARKSDIAIDFEPSSTQDTAAIARRGSTHWLIKAVGHEGHSSQIFTEALGYGAILEISRILNEMRTRLSGEKSLTFNPGIILGGTQVEYDERRGTSVGKVNIIAKTAISAGDLRYLTSDQKIKAEKRIETIVSQPLPGTSATVHFQDTLPPMPPTDHNLKLLEQYSQISQKLGYGSVKPLPPDLRGGGDISYIAPYVAANLVGIGAIGHGWHSPQETLEIDSLVIQSQRVALLIYALTR